MVKGWPSLALTLIRDVDSIHKCCCYVTYVTTVMTLLHAMHSGQARVVTFSCSNIRCRRHTCEKYNVSKLQFMNFS